MTKMTDEKLDALLKYVGRRDRDMGSGGTAEDEIRAHIAALTAERDDALGLLDIERAEVKALKSKRDALRERVRALEKLRDDYHVLMNSRGDWQSRAEHAESRLSAMRQRLDEVMDGRAPSHVLGWDKRTARYILGDDVPAPVSELDGLQEDVAPNASTETHTTNDVLECVSWCRACVENRGRGLNPDGTSVAADPTTAEAFAQIRAYLRATDEEEGSTWDPSNEEASLSLLERRMGVYTAAIRAVWADLNDKNEPTRVSRETIEMMQLAHAALADAPPVFTLEKLREVLHEGGYGTEDFESLRRALAARRK